MSLHENASAVRLDQQKLEHELDFVSAQQSELEEILKPLDASLANAALVPWTQIEKEFMRQIYIFIFISYI